MEEKIFLKRILTNRFFWIAFFFNIAEGITRITLSVKGGNIIDSVQKNAGYEILQIFVVAVILSFVIFLCITAKEGFYVRSLEAEIFNIKQTIFDSLIRMPLQNIKNVSCDELVASKLNDVNALSGALRPLVVMSFSLVVTRIETVLFLFWKNPFVTVSMLFFSPIILVAQNYISRSVQSKKKEELSAVQEILGEAARDIEAQEYVKATVLEKQVCDRFSTKQSKQLHALYSLKRIETAQEAMSYIAEWIPRLLLITAGAWQITQGSMTVGDLVVFSALANSATRLFAGFSDLKIKTDQARACLQRVMKEEEQEDEELKLGPSKDAVVFSHVTFGYECNPPILEDKSFIIHHGEIVRFSGSSGCGKSTALGLLCGLYIPWEGEICVFGAFNIKELRKKIAYVPQRPFLFDGTIYDNIACVNLHITYSQVKTILDNLGMSGWLLKQEHGLNTMVGEWGRFLSGGQRRRIAIARALAKDAPLLILDEVTAGLDEETEQLVYEYIVRNKGEKTIIIVSHQDVQIPKMHLIEF